jgi:hypothetical protein
VAFDPHVNTELGYLIGGADTLRFIKAQWIKWLGHIQRMDISRIAKRILELKPMGSQPLGRPRLRWLYDVCDDLKVLKVRNCKELAMDRKGWSDLDQKAKPTKGCSANGRRNCILLSMVTVVKQWVQLRDLLLHMYGFNCHTRMVHGPTLSGAYCASTSEV